MITIADLLLALTFVAQKKYQTMAGASAKAVLKYHALLGAVSTIVYLVINKFSIQVSFISVGMAVLLASFVLLYTVLGFKIIAKENVSLYTLFLMSGGMTVPYIWGVAFLGDELTTLRTIGLLAILAAILLSNSGVKKPDKKTLLLCITVFFLNGFFSVTAKMHQIHPVSEYVTSSDFALLTVFVRTLLCVGVLLFMKNEPKLEDAPKIPYVKILPIIVIAALADSVSFVLQLVGATQLPATVLYPFITGGCIIVTSLAGVLVFRDKLSVRQWMSVAVCFIGTLLFL